MENTLNPKPEFLTLFKEGLTLIFKKWSGFRLALDNNPQVLSYLGDDGELELHSVIDLLIEDILSAMEKDSGPILEQNVADLLYCFLEGYFDTELEDESELQIAKDVIKLHSALTNGKYDMLNKLKENKDKELGNIKYTIEFPILPRPIETEMESKAKIVEEPDEEGFVVVKKGKKF